MEGAGLELTPALIVAVVSAVIALALDLVPGLNERWEGLPKEVKRWVWLIGCVLVGVFPFVLACVGIGLFVGVVCTAPGLIASLELGFLAYFASQAAHGGYKGAVALLGGGDERSRPRRL